MKCKGIKASRSCDVKHIAKTSLVIRNHCKVIQISEKIAPSFHICFQRIPYFAKTRQLQEEELEFVRKDIIVKGLLPQLISEEDFSRRDILHMRPLVICDAKHVNRAQAIPFRSSFNLPLHDSRAIVQGFRS